MIFGDLWESLGGLLGVSWGILGGILGASGGPLGRLFGGLGELLSASMVPRGSKRNQGEPKRRLRGDQEPPRGLWEALLGQIFFRKNEDRIIVLFTSLSTRF